MIWTVTYQRWNGTTQTQLVKAASAERAKAVFQKLTGICDLAIFKIEERK